MNELLIQVRRNSLLAKFIPQELPSQKKPLAEALILFSFFGSLFFMGLLLYLHNQGSLSLLRKSVLFAHIFACALTPLLLSRAKFFSLAVSLHPLLFITYFPFVLNQSQGFSSPLLFIVVMLPMSSVAIISRTFGISIYVVLTLQIFEPFVAAALGISPLQQEPHLWGNFFMLQVVMVSTLALALLQEKKLQAKENGESYQAQNNLAPQPLQKSLEQARDWNQSLTRNMKDGLFTLSADGMILNCNRAAEKIFGYPVEELLGKHLDFLLPGFFKNNPFQNISRKKLLKRTTFGWDGQHKDNYLTPVEIWSAGQLIDEKGSLAIYTRDLTETQQLHKMQDNFISVVSHELRTPMTSILGSLQLLEGGAFGQLHPQAQNMVEIAIRNSKRLTRLLNDLLDIQKLKTEKLSMSLEFIQLDKFLRQATKDCCGFMEKYGVKLKLKGDIPRNRVLGDVDRLTQVFTNLVSNAAKHTPQGDTVSIFVKNEEGHLKVCVEDEGIGISDQFSENIFQKFQQADNSSVRKHEGTGLGLAISKAIIEQHGGKIGFYNKSPSGAVFWFKLEVADALSPPKEDLSQSLYQASLH